MDLNQCPGLKTCEHHISQVHYDLYCGRIQWIECPYARKFKSKFYKTPQEWFNKKVAETL